MKIDYINDETREIIKSWKPNADFDAESEIAIHLYDKLEIDEITIIKAENHGSYITFLAKSNIWKTAREFGLLDSGSLVW